MFEVQSKCGKERLYVTGLGERRKRGGGHKEICIWRGENEQRGHLYTALFHGEQMRFVFLPACYCTNWERNMVAFWHGPYGTE